MDNQNTTEVKFLTFNGLVITGKGKNREEAKANAEEQAKALGTCIRRRC